MNRTEIRILIAMNALFISGLAVSHFVVYGMLIVPKLPEFKEIPFYLVFAMVAPTAIVIIGFGFLIKSRKALVIFTLNAVALEQAFRLLLSISNQPGFRKEKVFSGSLFVVEIALAFILVFGLFSIGFLTMKAVNSNGSKT